jgi:hypothetical protein
MANLLIFYDWKEDLDHAAWAILALKFFETIGEKPNAGDFLGKDDRIHKIKLYDVVETLKKYGPQQAGLSTLLPPFDNVDNYRNECMYRDVPGERAKVSFFCFESAKLEVGLLSEITRSLTTVMHPAYGIGLLWPFRLSPAAFVFNGSTGHKIDGQIVRDIGERERILLWRQERWENQYSTIRAPFRHLQGMLRDVFPFNVLRKCHLEQAVNGIELRDWITADSANGSLQKIADEFWIWTISDQHLPRVQSMMKEAGLLITRIKTDTNLVNE